MSVHEETKIMIFIAPQGTSFQQGRCRGICLLHHHRCNVQMEDVSSTLVSRAEASGWQGSASEFPSYMLQDTQLCQYCRLAVRRADTRTWFWQQFHVQYDSSKSARYSEGERRASSAPAIATRQLRKGQQEPHRVGFFGPTGSARCCCGSTGRHITFMHHAKGKRHRQSHF